MKKLILMLLAPEATEPNSGAPAAPIEPAPAPVATPAADAGAPPVDPAVAAPATSVAPVTPPAPSIDVGALVRQQAELQTQAQQIQQGRAYLDQQAAQLKPYYDLAQKLQAAKGAPDLIADLIAEHAGMPFADVSKSIATRGPTSPEAMQALQATRSVQEEVARLRAELEVVNLQRSLQPVVDKYAAVKANFSGEQIAMAIRAGKAQNPNFQAEDLLAQQDKLMRDQARATLKADPTFRAELLKEYGAAAPARPAPGIGNTSAAPANIAPTDRMETEAERLRAAIAVGRAGLTGSSQ